MSRSLLLTIALCLFGPGLAHAYSVAPAEPPAEMRHNDSEWKSFDDLIAGAKASMMADPEAALQKARVARSFAQSNPDASRWSESFATSLWLEAEALSRINHIDEARTTIDRAILIAGRDGATTKLDGDLALSLGRIAGTKGDIALALRSFHKAHDLFAALDDRRGQAMALQALGSIYDEAHDFDRSIGYYRRAAQVYSGDPAVDLSAANNVGFALQQLGRYPEAVTHFRKALQIARSLNSPFLKARILTNLAASYARLHRFDESEDAADEALRLLGRRDVNGWAPFVWGVKAQLEFERGALDDAAVDLDRAFHGIDIAKTIAPFRDIHEVAYKVYRAKGDYDVALAHLEAFKRLDDDGRSLSASANLALRGAQFDFATQRLEIEHLRTEQLKRDISLRESEATTQAVILTGLILLSILLLVWIGLRNISVRKHRNEIAEANVALTSTVAERDVEIMRRKETEAQLRLAKEIAEQGNRAKAQFLANMSHELRTPLNAIIGFSEMMSSEILGSIGNDTYKGYAGDIYASGRHLLSILNDILDMARVDAGKVRLVDEDLVLGDVVQSALRVFSAEVQGAGKTIRLSAPDPKVMVRADQRLLRQIVINLVSNAVKFTGSDGIIDVMIERAKSGIDLVVRDNGMGIPEDKLAIVVQPFAQADDTFSRSHGGIGLGLAIVKSLAELHGGTLTLASKPNRGTVARVHLPANRIIATSETGAVRALA